MLIDTHCHLAFKAFDGDWQDAVKRARDKDTQMIAVGAAKSTSEKSITIAEASDGVFASIGLHPTHAEDEEFDVEWFAEKAKHPKVVAIGETGIDHFHIDDNRRHSERSDSGAKNPVNNPRDPSTRRVRLAQDDEERRGIILQRQEDLLRQHLRIAQNNNLPVILHTRDGKTESTGEAYNHLYKILTEFGYYRGVVHCFGGDWQTARKLLDIGLMLSFTGIVTFKNASQELREVVKNAPLDRFMIETDSPYLAPEPFRGKQNEPGFVEHVARGIANIRNQSYNAIIDITTENAIRFFNLP